MKNFDSCMKCKLHKCRRKVVVGRGKLPCDVLFIGEAPGVTEDMLGSAFIGESSMFLDGMLFRSGIDKYRLYFTNTVRNL